MPALRPQCVARIPFPEIPIYVHPCFYKNPQHTMRRENKQFYHGE